MLSVCLQDILSVVPITGADSTRNTKFLCFLKPIAIKEIMID
jgi:hypothetical protein